VVRFQQSGSGHISAGTAGRKIVGILDGKKYGNAGKMNFFLMSKVLFHGV
jgi:hypothetical protein